MRRTVATLLVAALVVLAGCAGGIAGPDAGATGDESSESGTVQFYVSDERNAIDQFEHLNVTVTSVGFAGGGAADANGTDADSESETEAVWVERDVDDRSVDLTELLGANATALGDLSVPEGDYETVFVRVGEVNGTLNSGEQADVKLPSQKLQLNAEFTVGSEQDVDFVFDVTVFEAGNSGKYVLKPVASESGTDVPIEDVDDREQGELDVSVVGSATAGGNATVQVTRGGEPVENAAVDVDGGTTVRTGANGTATVPVPADGELELEASSENGDDEAEGELELALGESRDDDQDDGDGEADDGDDSDDGTAPASADLAVAYEGAFAAGETVTVSVTDGDGEAVEDATVEFDGEVVGETDANGELGVELPADVSLGSQLTVTADGESVTVDASTVAAAN